MVFDALVEGAGLLFSWGPLLGMLIVLPVALLSGLIPGGGLPTAVVILGLAWTIDPLVAATVVVFSMAASDITEPVPAILLGIPGSRTSQATVLDGYPLSQQGKAGYALGASYTCTLVGGLFGGLALLTSLPVARELVKYFGSAEFFLLALMGIFAVALVSQGAMVKGLLTSAFGMGIATVGYSVQGNVVRADMGLNYLWEGITLTPIIVGLFALPELIDLVMSNSRVNRTAAATELAFAREQVYAGMRTALRDHKFLLFRSSLIGTFVGAMPGVGGSAGHWIAYSNARQTEKGASKTFGRGDIRGVIAADASNNSSDGGVLIPTILFGIPGSAGMAILLAILVLGGMNPGPSMLSEQLPFTMAIILTLMLANVIVVPIMLYAAPLVMRLADTPPAVIAAPTIGVVTLAAFSANFSLADLVVVAVFMVMGMFMKAYGWPRPPILIAIVLTPILEQYFNIAINAYGWGMFSRPQFITIAVIMVAVLLYSVKLQREARRSSSAPSDTVAVAESA
jgi:TctA family transporter